MHLIQKKYFIIFSFSTDLTVLHLKLHCGRDFYHKPKFSTFWEDF